MAFAAAKWAIEVVRLSHSAISTTLVEGGLGTLPEVVAELESQYLELQELLEKGIGAQQDVLTAFCRARAATALEFAIRGEPLEAVYEAGMAVGDWKKLGEIAASYLNG